MFRDNTPFSETGRDECLPLFEQLDENHRAYRHFSKDESTPTFSSFDGDVLDDLSIELHDGSIAPANSRTESGAATPENTSSPEIDFGGFTFERNHYGVHTYPVPGELDRRNDSYPPHLDTPNSLYQKTTEHSLPHRSITNANTGYDPSAVQNFNRTHAPSHRRSWSQNDVERLPVLAPQHYPHGVRHQPPHPRQHAPTNANPTFVRLCETRHSRPPSRISRDSKGPVRYEQSQTRPGYNGPANPPTSIPLGVGMPLQPTHRAVPTSGNVQLTGPKLVHMSHGEQQRTSQKIIEVGAMAVLNMPSADGQVQNIDPRLVFLGHEGRKRDKSSAPSPEAMVARKEPREKMLEDLRKMEKLLKEGGDGEEGRKALEGCEMIREVLAKMGDMGGGNRSERRGDERRVDDNVEASSPVASDEGSPLTDEELMRELVGDFSSP